MAGPGSRSQHEPRRRPGPRGPLRFDDLSAEVRAAFLDDGGGRLDFWSSFIDEASSDSTANVPTDLRPHVEFLVECGKRRTVWKRSGIEEWIRRARERDPSLPSPQHYPGATQQLYQLLDEVDLSGKSLAVVGSISPWIEAILLSAGAVVTTVDYNPVQCEHPAIRSIAANDLFEMHDCFDAVVSYSSIEHDGLGRYGDPIDPDGDLCAMSELRQVLKAGGTLYLGVPMHHHDALRFNADRLYGPIRFAKLLDGWSIIGQTPAQLDGISRSLPDYWMSWREAFTGVREGRSFRSRTNPATRHERGEHPIWWLRPTPQPSR